MLILGFIIIDYLFIYLNTKYADSFQLSDRYLRISTRYKAIFISTYFDLNS